MEEATHVAWVSVLIETSWRVYKCNGLLANYFFPIRVYLRAYFMCIVVIFLDIKKYNFFKSPRLRSLLSFLHSIDGVVALVLSLAHYYKSELLLNIGVLMIAKCFLLHLLSRMVTGQAAFGPLAVSLQTTKTFLHHTGSFLFLGNDNTALITGCWRFISMNGHAAMTLREKLNESTYDRIMWAITHARNVMMALVILICFINADIRRGFALSGTGHVAYLIVRLGPVFRIGSMYLPSSEEKKKWHDFTDVQRIQVLVSGAHPWFTLELGLLVFLCIYFTALRLTTYGIFLEDTCEVI